MRCLLNKWLVVGSFIFNVFSMDYTGENMKDAENQAESIQKYSFSLMSISPGVYKEDNIEAILHCALREFGEEDIVIFDVDEVLITGLNPYHFEHFLKKTQLNERLFSCSPSTIDKFFQYMFSTQSWACMDKRLPDFVRRLQQQGVKCIANTALPPIINSELDIDFAALRIQALLSFGFNFSEAFSHLSLWNFGTLDSKHIPKFCPLFKEGVIFSSKTPKHISTTELFKKVNFNPRRVLFIDDSSENSHAMFTELSSQRIECYSFIYTKKDMGSLRDYFSEEVFARELGRLEFFIEELINEENKNEKL